MSFIRRFLLRRMAPETWEPARFRKKKVGIPIRRRG